MKLNLASGVHPTDLPGWVNVDLPWYGVIDPDVYADAMRLPFPAAAFDGAYLGHFLEHVEIADLPALGAELRRVVQPGAPVMTVGPDMARATARHEPQWLLDAISTKKAGPGGHKWVATEAATVAACILMGLSDVLPVAVGTVTPPTFPNPTCAGWQCAVSASA